MRDLGQPLLPLHELDLNICPENLEDVEGFAFDERGGQRARRRRLTRRRDSRFRTFSQSATASGRSHYAELEQPQSVVPGVHIRLTHDVQQCFARS